MKVSFFVILQHPIFKFGSFRKVALYQLLFFWAVMANSVEQALAIPLEPAFFEFLEKFHGHTCAGSLMGARLGLEAKAALKAAGGEGKLKAKYFNHSCPVDGVQVAAGTTYGNRTIEVEDRKEQRLLLTAEKNGRQVEASLTKLAEEKGKRSLELKNKMRKLPSNSPQREQMEKEVENILNWFRNAPNADVVIIKVIK